MARILIIDDEPQVCALLKTALDDMGYETATATDGREGLQRFRLHPADLVITDVVMPELDGHETIARLVRQYPKVNIIAMTGKPGAETLLQTAELLGANKVLKKPFELKQLFSLVQEVLNQQEGQALTKLA